MISPVIGCNGGRAAPEPNGHQADTRPPLPRPQATYAHIHEKVEKVESKDSYKKVEAKDSYKKVEAKDAYGKKDSYGKDAYAPAEMVAVKGA
jgi:hypothetical protein